MNSMLTALTRPRMALGVETCTRVPRTITLTMSAPPRTMSVATESQKLRESANRMVHRPNTATHTNMRRPARPRIG